jgi:hypothetical protein
MQPLRKGALAHLAQAFDPSVCWNKKTSGEA